MIKLYLDVFVLKMIVSNYESTYFGKSIYVICVKMSCLFERELSSLRRMRKELEKYLTHLYFLSLLCLINRKNTGFCT